FDGIAARMARLPVRRRQHDLAMKPLQRPAVRDESRGQILEQLGMRGREPLHAEVARGAYQMLVEMPAPQAVDDDTCTERRGIGKNLFTEFEPARSVVKLGRS